MRCRVLAYLLSLLSLACTKPVPAGGQAARPAAEGRLGHVRASDSVDLSAVVQTVAVEGMNWTWRYQYDAGVESDELLLRPGLVQLSFTSRDVKHRFVLEALGLDVRVLPGESQTVFVEVSSLGEAQTGPDGSCRRGPTPCMETTARVLEPDELARRVVRLSGPLLSEGDSWPSYGEQVFSEVGCVACHSTDGTPHVGPTLQGVAGTMRSLEGGGTVLADAAYLERAIRVPGAEVSEGFVNSQPSYDGLLTDNQLRGLLAYLQCLGVSPPAELSCPGEGPR